MYYNMELCGFRIQALRRDKGVTQEKLASDLNINRNTIGKLERGERGLSIDLLIDLAGYFGVSTDYILLGADTDKAALKKQLSSLICQLEKIEKSL